MKIRQAVILAGGLGTRLKPITDKIPKPMITFHGKPFLEYLINNLKENKIEEIVLLVGYMHEKIQEYFGDGKKFGIQIKYSVGPLEWDTGTRIKNVQHILDKNFLLMYCDNVWPLNLQKLITFHENKNALMTLTIFTNRDKSTKSNILVDETGYVTLYDKSRTEQNLSGVDIGFFIVNKKVVEEFMPDGDFSLQQTLIQLVQKHELAGFLTNHKYYSVGSIERLPLTERYLAPRKIVFLDRDGVINRKAPKAEYITQWSEFIFLPEVLESLKKLTENGFEIYIISNQAGIARGKMTIKDLDEMHEKMKEILHDKGIIINGIYYCPHGWDEGCECRKPRPGMLFKAAQEHQIDLTKALFIGDDERDKQAGDAADIETILVNPDKGLIESMDIILTR